MEIQNKNGMPATKDAPFPHADTEAALTLQSALNRAKAKKKPSLRSAAILIDYKQAGVLSHMASGRVPIPDERAEEITTVLNLNPRAFIKLDFKQRYPNMPLSV